MGNYSSKDNFGPAGPHAEIFHTPPSSPQSDGAQLQPGQSPASSPPSASATTPSGKKTPQCIPVPVRSSIPPPDWSPPPPVGPNTNRLRVSPTTKATGSALVGKGRSSWGKNSTPPRITLPQTKNVADSAVRNPSFVTTVAPAPSSLGLASTEESVDVKSEPVFLPGDDKSQDQELVELLKECASTLGTTLNQSRSQNIKDVLKHLMTEVKSLKTTLQTERGEWLQFQADLQVAVSVADRLRAETEEELVALRKAHSDIDRELAAAQQRQKEADLQLVTLQKELEESRQRMDSFKQPQVQADAAASRHQPGWPNVGSNTESTEETVRGKGTNPKTQREVVRSEAAEGTKMDCKGVAKRYLRNVTNEERCGKEVRISETPKTGASERSRSLSRLPSSSNCINRQNGTAQQNSAATLEIPRNFGQNSGWRGSDRQQDQSNSDAGKREESLNKYNSALTELPLIKSQDGLSLLLRRHGGSKRNSLLRWCQNRTNTYKNIDITNFSSSWADGLAFCAVYHTYLPSHIPYSSLSPENKKENLNLAFKTGQSVGIAQSLTVEEMLRAGGPDWQRVLSYVEDMYRHFEM